MLKKSILIAFLLVSAYAHAVPRKINDDAPALLAVNKMFQTKTTSFSKVLFFEETGFTCGYVSGKSLKGSFTGKVMFFVDGDMQVTLEPEDPSSITDLEKAAVKGREYLAFLHAFKRNCTSQ